MICFLADFPGVDNDGAFLVLGEGVRGVHVMLSLPLFYIRRRPRRQFRAVLRFLRRKIKIALFPLTCRRRGRVGRSENLFYFSCIFSFLKKG